MAFSMQFSAVILFLVLSGVSLRWSQADCPPGVEERVLQCVRGMQAFTAATTPQEHRQACSSAYTGIECVHSELGTCGSLEDTQMGDVTTGLNQLQQQLKAICHREETPPTTMNPVVKVGRPGNRGRCTSGVMRKLRRCAARLRRVSKKSPVRCGLVRKATTCLDQTMNRCRQDIKGRLRSRVEALKGQLLSVCENRPVRETTTQPASTPQVVIETGECPSDFQQRITSCSEKVNQLTEAAGVSGVDEMCGLARASVDCMSYLYERCSGKPEIDQMDNLLNIDTTREFIRQGCPKTTPETCPADYKAQAEACAQPFGTMQVVVQNQGRASFCRQIQEAYRCLHDIIGKCSDTELQAFYATLTEADASTAINSLCPSIRFPGASKSVADSCPADYKKRRTTCVERLQNLDQVLKNRGIDRACSVLSGGLDCLDELRRDCPSKPEIRSLSTDKLRKMMKRMCAGNRVVKY